MFYFDLSEHNASDYCSDSDSVTGGNKVKNIFFYPQINSSCRLELNMELPSGQQSQPIGTASTASAEQVQLGYFLL